MQVQGIECMKPYTRYTLICNFVGDERNEVGSSRVMVNYNGQEE